MADVYDEAVAHLTEHPDEIYESWGDYSGLGGLLFMDAARDDYDRNDMLCGCLTQIRCGIFRAQTNELTEAIRADERIPSNGGDITVEHLPLFAEWQRRIDAELGRTPPEKP